MTTDMRKDFGFETEFADCFAVGSRLFRSSGGRKFDVFDAKLIESFSDFDFFGGIKEGVCKLFSLPLVLLVPPRLKGLFTKVDSMIEKFDTRERKSSARGRTRQ